MGFDRVDLSYDPAKRAKTLAELGLDFEDSGQVFAGTTIEAVDDRQDLWRGPMANVRPVADPAREHRLDPAW